MESDYHCGEKKAEKEERDCWGSYQNRKIRKIFTKQVSFEGRFECEIVSHSNFKHKRNQALKIATGKTLRQDYT